MTVVIVVVESLNSWTVKTWDSRWNYLGIPSRV